MALLRLPLLFVKSPMMIGSTLQSGFVLYHCSTGWDTSVLHCHRTIARVYPEAFQFAVCMTQQYFCTCMIQQYEQDTGVLLVLRRNYSWTKASRLNSWLESQNIRRYSGDDRSPLAKYIFPGVIDDRGSHKLVTAQDARIQISFDNSIIPSGVIAAARSTRG